MQAKETGIFLDLTSSDDDLPIQKPTTPTEDSPVQDPVQETQETRVKKKRKRSVELTDDSDSDHDLFLSNNQIPQPAASSSRDNDIPQPAASSSSQDDLINNEQDDLPVAKRQKLDSPYYSQEDSKDGEETEYEDNVPATNPTIKAKKKQNNKTVEKIILKKISLPTYTPIQRQQYDNLVNVAKRYVAGDAQILIAETDLRKRSFFLAAIAETQNIESAQKYLKKIDQNKHKELLESAANLVIQFGTPQALNCLIRLGLDLVNHNAKYVDYTAISTDILHLASQNLDQFKMFQHIINIIGNEQSKKILNSNTNRFLIITKKAMEDKNFELAKILLNLASRETIEHEYSNYCSDILIFASKLQDDGAMLKLIIEKISRNSLKKNALPERCMALEPIFLAYKYGCLQNFILLLEMFSADELFAWRSFRDGVNIIKQATDHIYSLEILKLLVDKLGNEKAAKLIDEKTRSGFTTRTNTIRYNDRAAFDFLATLTPNWTNNQQLVCEILHYAQTHNANFFEYISSNYFSINGKEVESVGEIYKRLASNYLGQINYQPQGVSLSTPPQAPSLAPQLRPQQPQFAPQQTSLTARSATPPQAPRAAKTRYDELSFTVSPQTPQVPKQVQNQSPQAPSVGPQFRPQQPHFGPQQPHFGPQQPHFGPQQSHFGPQQPHFGPQQPHFGPQQSHFGPQQSHFGPQQRHFGPQQSQFGPGPHQPMQAARSATLPQPPRLVMPPQPPRLASQFGSQQSSQVLSSETPPQLPISAAAIQAPGPQQIQPPRTISESVPPLSSSPNNLGSVSNNALAQTALNNLDLLEALKQSVQSGPQSSVSSQIELHLEILRGLFMAHNAMTQNQISSSSSNSIGK